MTSPDLRAECPALSAAADILVDSATSLAEAGTCLELLPAASVDAALPGAATSEAFRAAVRAWAVVARCVADDLRTLGLRFRETAAGLESVDAQLVVQLPRDTPR